jgi:8-oxo-dGTP diphosphatase
LTPGDSARPIHVVAGVVIDRRARILIAQRPPGKHLAGGWEFPGGKLEPGEARAVGLARELSEEIGIAIDKPRPLMRLRHRYSHGEVLLDVWVVRRYRGEPRGLDGQALRWCRRAALATANLLPADRPIIDALRLPECLRQSATAAYEVSAIDDFSKIEAGRRAPRLRGVLCRDGDQAAAAAAAGADFVVLREALAHADLAALCARVMAPVFARGVALERAWSLGASGVTALA